MKKIQKWKSQFIIVALGQAVSMLGSHGVQFALIWWLAEKTSSPFMLGIRACRLSPNVVIQPDCRHCGRPLQPKVYLYFFGHGNGNHCTDLRSDAVLF